MKNEKKYEQNHNPDLEGCPTTLWLHPWKPTCPQTRDYFSREYREYIWTNHWKSQGTVVRFQGSIIAIIISISMVNHLNPQPYG